MKTFFRICFAIFAFFPVVLVLMLNARPEPLTHAAIILAAVWCGLSIFAALVAAWLAEFN